MPQKNRLVAAFYEINTYGIIFTFGQIIEIQGAPQSPHLNPDYRIQIRTEIFITVKYLPSNSVLFELITAMVQSFIDQIP